MDNAKRARLEAAGWKVGDVAGFLGLTAAEEALVEMRLALAAELRAKREGSGLSQVALAKRLGSSQSRVAKMEASDATVSIDLLLRSLLVLGVTPQEIGRSIANSGRPARPARTTRTVRTRA